MLPTQAEVDEVLQVQVLGNLKNSQVGKNTEHTFFTWQLRLHVLGSLAHGTGSCFSPIKEKAILDFKNSPLVSKDPLSKGNKSVTHPS